MCFACIVKIKIHKDIKNKNNKRRKKFNKTEILKRETRICVNSGSARDTDID